MQKSAHDYIQARQENYRVFTHPDLSDANIQSILKTSDRPGSLMVYVAGPIRRDPDYFSNFAKAADRLRQQGYSVYNPAAANLEGRPLAEIMRHVLPALCECQAIAMLPGWWRSGGARIEWALARYLGLRRIKL